jgi:hypothetical protein
MREVDVVEDQVLFMGLDHLVEQFTGDLAKILALADAPVREAAAQIGAAAEPALRMALVALLGELSDQVRDSDCGLQLEIQPEGRDARVVVRTNAVATAAS